MSAIAPGGSVAECAAYEPLDTLFLWWLGQTAQPRLVVCDEITSSLDVSVQSTISSLLVDLQRETGTACLFITHDLNLVRQLAHRIVVMQNGRVVDLFQTRDAEAPERYEYTQALLEAVTPPTDLTDPLERNLEGIAE